jgi:hypothetical protein
MTVDFKSTPAEPLALQARVVQFSHRWDIPRRLGRTSNGGNSVCRVASEEMLLGVVVASPEMLPASERVNMPSHQGRHHGQQDDAHGPDGTR